ncbi:hypothetical protein C9374_002512 [Naegleria lovaniensis]|uniref:Guanylate cyclase domain-containing protein n=1 Tax=Naegleria lovaniensis TaxID=51637 RepID=A0AA88KLL3_NAELO|nr:uncharacterized protein C9374_002512 [Naegleria lovaniensis]KAG2386768.1 hypothetical protein C9374_002512 [Naegleria lovaniensis]
MKTVSSSRRVLPVKTSTEDSSSSVDLSHNDEDDDQSLVSHSQQHLNTKPPISSIKCMLILLVTTAIVAAVAFLTSIWISCFSSSVSTMSQDLMSQHFYKIITFTDETFKQVIMTSESAKNTMWFDLNYNNTDYINRTTFKIFKSAYQFLSTLMIDAYIGDPKGGNKGIMMMNGIPSILLVNESGQYWTYCDNFQMHEQCLTKSSTPDVTLPPFDMSGLLEIAQNHANRPRFTMSYTDPTLPTITFLSLVNSKPAQAPIAYGKPAFEWYFGFDITVTTISEYFKQITDDIGGSMAFAIETSTDYIVASSFPTIAVTIWDANGNQKRKTALDFDIPLVNDIGKFVYSELSQNLSSIPCNSFLLKQYQDRYVNIHRMCNDANIDWIFIFSVPKWNYIQTMIIAIVAASVSSIFIIGVGIVLGVFASLRIVKPFQNLIYLFESVSNMDLDTVSNDDTNLSHLKEVYILQQHFHTMVRKIRKYRCFIPPHLLAQLDSLQDEEGNETGKKDPTGDGSAPSRPSMSQDAPSSRGSQCSRRASSMKQQVSKSLFRLGLEKKPLTIACIHFGGLDSCMEVLNDSELVPIMSDFFDIIQKIARMSGGQLGNFENNEMTISWNSTSDIPYHEEKGLASTKQIMEKLTQLTSTKWKNKESLVKKDLLNVVNFKAAIVSQICKSGNVGTQEVKSFSIVGSYIHNLEILLKHAFKLNISIVASDVIHDKCSKSFQMRYVGTRKLYPPEFTNPPSLVKFKSNSSMNDKLMKTKLYEIGESNNNDIQDEWMYELQHKERKEKWKTYHVAVNHYMEKQYDQAIQHFEEYLHGAASPHQEDACAVYLLKKCYKKEKKQQKKNGELESV